MLSLDSYLPVTLFQSNGDVQEHSESGDTFYMHHHQQDQQQQQQQQQQQRVLNKSLSFGSSDADYLADSVKDSLFAKFLPSNNEDEAFVDAYSCDDFRMYEFKVRRCMRGRSHDWTECPFAHPGEKARRRDPRRFHYSGTACPDFRKGSCRRGDACEFAHGVFECWLHPARYRTQPCKDGRNCKRRVCFFAHTQQQLRLLPGNSSSSPKSGGKSVLGSSGAYRHVTGLDSTLGFESCANPNTSNRGFMKSNLAVTSSPTSTLVGHSHSPPPLSPPLSPTGSSSPHENSWPNTQALYQKALSFDSALYNNTPPRRHPTITIPVSPDSRSMSSPLASEGSCSPFAQSSPKKSIADLINSLQNLELSNGNGANSVGSGGSRPWLQAHNSGACYAQSPPRSSNLRHCSYSLPCTPTKSGWDANIWEQDMMEEAPHRVESGRDLRAQIYGRLSREASEIKEANRNADSPDLAWVNDLIK